MSPSATDQYRAWKQNYHSELARRAKESIREKVMSGEVVGKLPLGYRFSYVRGRKTAVIQEEEAQFVLHAFRLAGNPKASVRAILANLEKLGCTARTGKPLGVSTLHKMLSNPFYAGIIRHRGELYHGMYVPLVPVELFEQVQRNLASRRKTKVDI